jgi:predicted nucleic acid-binding protein
MKTALDSNIISAILCVEPTSSDLISLLGRLRVQGTLVICGTVYAEVHAIPCITPQILAKFLKETGISVEPVTTLDDWTVIGRAFSEYADRRRNNGDGQGKRLLADFVVGTHAAQYCDQLLTLDPKRYNQAFPKLKLIGLE